MLLICGYPALDVHTYVFKIVWITCCNVDHLLSESCELAVLIVECGGLYQITDEKRVGAMV